MIDAAFMSHAILWFIGLMSAGAVVSVAAALYSLGRSGYRND